MITETKRRCSNSEKQLLLQDFLSSQNAGKCRQQPSSRLECAESSYIRLLNLLFWTWIYPLLSLGHRQELTESDLEQTPNIDKSSILSERLHLHDWSSTTTWKIVLKEFWKEYIWANLVLIPFLIISIGQPWFLYQFLLNMANQHQSNPTSYISLIMLLLCVFIFPLLERQALFRARRIGIRIRNTLMITIYRRILSLKANSAEQINIGHIINLVANETSKFEDTFAYLAFLFESCLETIIQFGLLCLIMSPFSIFCSFALFCLFILIQLYFSRKFRLYREITAQRTDKRIQMFAEFINGSHTVKMYNWENSVRDQIIKMRNDELESIRQTSRLRAFNMTQFFTSTSLLSLVTFGSAWLLDYTLNSSNTFPVILSFGLIRYNAVFNIPTASEKIGEVRFASQGIDELMQLCIQHKHLSYSVLSLADQHKKGCIMISYATFSWCDAVPCLSAINLSVDNGTFVGIIGPVGSGKSSLLAAILGEMNLIHGQLYTNTSSFSYAAQSPWIFSGTIRENIVLNQSFDEELYKRVICTCCLDVDFDMLGSTGDLTIIGENGVNLSGGQKARIGLARALYADADIYLLDDPFSALDRIVAREIYERCIGPRGLLKNKTRLLVTHHIQFLNEANQVLCLSNGHIEKDARLNARIIQEKDYEEDKILTLANTFDLKSSANDNESIITNEISDYKGAKLSIWYEWFTAPPLGIFGFCSLICLMLLCETLNDAANYFLSIWLEKLKPNGKVSPMCAYIYLGLTTGTVIIDIARTNLFFTIVLNGSNTFHNKMLNGLLQTAIHFFESNPTGRILNRASRDQHVIDHVLPITLLHGIILFLIVDGSLLIICIVNPFMIILILILILIIWYTTNFYQKSCRQLKQIENRTRSPIYSLFSRTMNGLTTIRVFQTEEKFIKMLSDAIDINTSACLATHAASQWFALVLSFICSLMLLATSIEILIFQDQIEVSKAGLTLTSAICFTIAFQWAIRILSEADIYMTSGTRIDEYSRLPREEDNILRKDVVEHLAEWPKKGTIQFLHYSLRYRSNLKYAIRNLTLPIEAGQKIGIIGRTGAGKSSLFKGIFRFINQSNINGQILIDDVNINSIPLDYLRSRITIIPQDPIIFTNTLRYNLDPCNLYSDEQCWKALADVRLTSFVILHPAGLLMNITESGNNLSKGQRQLIGIARAILKNSKILLIDEATANVDQQTDKLIQEVIHEKFVDRTVLIIAHRLETITMCDRILVISNGMMLNCDTPDNIL